MGVPGRKRGLRLKCRDFSKGGPTECFKRPWDFVTPDYYSLSLVFESIESWKTERTTSAKAVPFGGIRESLEGSHKFLKQRDRPKLSIAAFVREGSEKHSKKKKRRVKISRRGISTDRKRFPGKTCQNYKSPLGWWGKGIKKTEKTLGPGKVDPLSAAGATEINNLIVVPQLDPFPLNLREKNTWRKGNKRYRRFAGLASYGSLRIFTRAGSESLGGSNAW